MNAINPFDKGTDAAGIFSGTAAGMVNGGVQAGIFDTKPNWGSIAAQSFGSAVGDSFTQQKVATDQQAGVVSGGRGLRAGEGTASTWGPQYSFEDTGIDGANYSLAGGGARVGGGADDVSQANSYTVARGDSVERIARQNYGENWRAGVAAIMASNGISKTDRYGNPVIQSGANLVLPDLGGASSDANAQLARIGGDVIAANSRQSTSVHMAEQLAAAQATSSAAAGACTPDNPYGLTAAEQNAIAKEQFGRLPIDGGDAASGYAQMRAPVLSARETATAWVSSLVGNSRAGNVITGAVDAWLAPAEALSNVNLLDAAAALPSAAARVVNAGVAYAGQVLNDPLGTVASTMAGGVDGLRSGFNRTVNGDGRAMGSALFALGTAGVPLGRAGSITGALDFIEGSGRLGGEIYGAKRLEQLGLTLPLDSVSHSWTTHWLAGVDRRASLLRTASD